MATSENRGHPRSVAASWPTDPGPPATSISGRSVVESSTSSTRRPGSQLSAALRRAGPLAFAGAAANVANVIVTVMIAHLLTPRDYGSLGQLLVLFLLLSMPGSALVVAVVRRVTAWQLAGQGDRVEAWASDMRRWGLVGLGLLALVAWLGRSWLATQLSLPSPAGVAEVLIAGGAWALLCFERGLIQADRDYEGLAWNLGTEAAVRTTLTVGLIAAGLAVEGAALALLAAMGAAIAHARWAETRSRRAHGRARPGPDGSEPTPEVAPVIEPSPVLPLDDDEDRTPVSAVGKPSERALRHEAGRRFVAIDLATALVALFLLAALQGLDVEIVGRDAPGSVGPYNAISVASKAVVFLAIVLSGYLLPEAVVRWRRGEHALRQLGVALGLIAVPVAALAVLATAFPTEVLRVLFGPDKVRAAPAFATLALAMGCLAATTLFTYYLLGIGRRLVVGVLASAAVVTVALVNLAHGHALSTARAELGCQGVLAVVTGLLVVTARRQSRPVA